MCHPARLARFEFCKHPCLFSFCWPFPLSGQRSRRERPEVCGGMSILVLKETPVAISKTWPVIGTQRSKQCKIRRGAALSQMAANIWPRPHVPQALSSSCMSCAAGWHPLKASRQGKCPCSTLQMRKLRVGEVGLQPIVFVSLPWGGHKVTDRVNI